MSAEETKTLITVLTALVGAVGTLVIGIYTGRKGLKNDETNAANALESTRIKREEAEEQASQKRVERLAEDAMQERKTRLEVEARLAAQLEICHERSAQGWTLANLHFNLVHLLAFLLRNVTQVPDDQQAVILDAVRHARGRLNNITIPSRVTEPLTAEIRK